MGRVVDDSLRGDLIIYGKANGEGYQTPIDRSKPDLTEVKGHGNPIGDGLGGNWNDEITSFRITRGVWRFWEHVGYEGKSTQEFGPGMYDDIRNYGFPKDTVSSIELVRETP